MNGFDKAFIKAYGQQPSAPISLMSLSAALNLSRESASDSGAEEETNTNSESPTEEITTEDCVAEERPVASQEKHSQAMPEFQPLLQVDAFVWPKACDRLAAADDQLEALAENLDIQVENGCKMIGFMSDQAGSGCTTLLLSVARRLAQRCRVALVDANHDNPSIARDLGLLPDLGLKDVAAGRVPLDEALIESLDDGLALLPYAGHAETEYGDDRHACSTNLRQLANHYDLVLVDLGAGDSSTLSQIDAAVIVRDARGERSSGSSRGKEILQGAGVGIVGIVENRTIAAPETQDSESEGADDFYSAA